MKILVRSAMPFEGTDNISEILINNLVGNNTGNLLFQSSVERIAMTEEVEITTINVNRDYTEEEIERMNAEYSMFLIPLANAFRVEFMKELEKIRNLVRRLNMPCVVIGVGIQRQIGSDKWNYRFDELVKSFMEAVLEKSAIVGLRGEITAQYLEHIGFQREKDFTIIGCPSLYMYGEALPEVRNVNLTEKSPISVTFKKELTPPLYRYIREQCREFENYQFITQIIQEIRMLYIGFPYNWKKKGEAYLRDYPSSITDEMILGNHMVGVLDLKSWMDYLRTRDFSFGSRIHGNVANVLAGTPCFIIPSDLRVLEICQYHNLPHKRFDEIKEGTSILDLYEKTDYGMIKKGHKERVAHYFEFLDKNGVKHLSGEQVQRRDTPFDRHLEEMPSAGAIMPFSTVSLEEQERRLLEYTSFTDRRYKEARKNMNREKKDLLGMIQKLEKENGKLNKELKDIKCRKSYKMQVKYDAFRKKFR